MSVIAKTNPVGIDVVVNRIQNRIESRLGWSAWENNHRAYINPKRNDQNGFIAEVYVSDGEYRECFYDDAFNATSFFFDTGERTIEDGMATVQMAWILQIDLAKVFPAISHRADEECWNAVLNAFQGIADIELISTETGIEDVYREFDTTNLKYDNMSNLYVLRINFSTTINAKCCTNC